MHFFIEFVVAICVAGAVSVTTAIYLGARDRVAKRAYIIGLAVVASAALFIGPIRFAQLFFESFDISLPHLWLFPAALAFMVAAPFWKRRRSRRHGLERRGPV